MIYGINVWAMLIAAFSMLVIGGIWYSPLLFGRLWMRITGITGQEKSTHKLGVFVSAFILALIAAFGFTLLLGEEPDFAMSVLVGFIGGVFVVTAFGINYLFAGRSMKLFCIDGGFHLVQFTVYGVIFGLWH